MEVCDCKIDRAQNLYNLIHEWFPNLNSEPFGNLDDDAKKNWGQIVTRKHKPKERAQLRALAPTKENNVGQKAHCQSKDELPERPKQSWFARALNNKPKPKAKPKPKPSLDWNEIALKRANRNGNGNGNPPWLKDPETGSDADNDQKYSSSEKSFTLKIEKPKPKPKPKAKASAKLKSKDSSSSKAVTDPPPVSLSELLKFKRDVIQSSTKHPKLSPWQLNC